MDIRRWIGLMVLASLWFGGIAHARFGRTVMVDTVQELGDAIQNAQDFDNIVIAPGTYMLEAVFGTTALPRVERDLQLIGGPGGEVVLVGGGPGSDFRALDVADDVIIEGITFRDFHTADGGGAIRSITSLTLQDCAFENNSSNANGGALFLRYDSEVPPRIELFVRNCRFDGNMSGANGGGIYVDQATDFSSEDRVEISNSRFQNNSAIAGGGFFAEVSDVRVDSSNFRDNMADFACDGVLAGFNMRGRFQLHQNTFESTCERFQLEIRAGTTDINGNTFRTNSTEPVLFTTTDDAVDLSGNSIVTPLPQKSESRDKSACFDARFAGIIQSSGFNIITDDSCNLDQATDQPNTDAMLGTLQDDGSIPLLAGSPAIDSGASSLRLDVEGVTRLPCGYKDSRGLGRPQDANLDGNYECDIGSYEVQGGPEIGAAQSGAVFDPSRNGEGAFVEVLPDGRALVAEFTYRLDGSGVAWFLGLGEVVGNSIVLDEVLQPVGGVFGAGFNADAIDRQLVGSMSLVFSNCDSTGNPGRLAFQAGPDGQFEDLLVAATRLSTIVDCQGGASARAGRSGSFFDPSRSGEGIFVQWLIDGRVLIIWYTFDPEGNQLWIVSDAVTFNGNSLTATMLYPAASTSFGNGFNPAEIDLQTWGTVTLEYQPGCNDLVFSYASTVAGFGSGSYNYSRLTSLAGTSCDL